MRTKHGTTSGAVPHLRPSQPLCTMFEKRNAKNKLVKN